MSIFLTRYSDIELLFTFVKMTKKLCAVVGCKNLNKDENSKENGITFFTVPKASLSRWQSLIPSAKLTRDSRLCSRHFDEDDIMKGYVILNVFHPNIRWRLKPGANPKHLLNCCGKNYHFPTVK